MKGFEYINKTREYLDYIEDHLKNVQKSWDEIKIKCKDMRFMYDDFFYFSINDAIENHDVSKLSEFELVQYRESFFPVNESRKLGEAWDHHKNNNPHHWENWTSIPYDYASWEVHCVCMICDWQAMGYKFGDTAKGYYEKNKDKINIPEKMIPFMYEIFNRLEV